MLQPFHFSALDVIESTHDTSVQVFDNIIFSNKMCHPSGMVAGIVVNAIVGLYRKLYTFDDELNVVGQISSMTSRRNRTTSAVAHYHYQSSTKMFDSIFYGAEDVLIYHITRIADDEEVAQLLVEDDFRYHATIGAAEHHGKRLLPRAKFLP